LTPATRASDRRLQRRLGGRQAREDREACGRWSQASRLILLMEGANDLNQELRPGEGFNARVSDVVNALEDFVRDAGFRNIPVLIATLPPQRPGGPKAWSIELLPRFNAAIVEMAGKKGAGVVDIAQLPLALIGQDGLHPTEAGYERIAATWLDAVRARYEKIPD
jgi:lysophospholipase L1-like esterase